MKVLLAALGSRGDVQPLAVLGAALRRAGHEALLAIPPDGGAIAQAHEVPFVPCVAPLIGGSGAVTSTERVHVVSSVSHAALFPRMRAIVHHCGAGTTAAATRAGVPQVAVPHSSISRCGRCASSNAA